MVHIYVCVIRMCTSYLTTIIFLSFYRSAMQNRVLQNLSPYPNPSLALPPSSNIISACMYITRLSISYFMLFNFSVNYLLMRYLILYQTINVKYNCNEFRVPLNTDTSLRRNVFFSFALKCLFRFIWSINYPFNRVTKQREIFVMMIGMSGAFRTRYCIL